MPLFPYLQRPELSKSHIRNRFSKTSTTQHRNSNLAKITIQYTASDILWGKGNSRFSKLDSFCAMSNYFIAQPSAPVAATEGTAQCPSKPDESSDAGNHSDAVFPKTIGLDDESVLLTVGGPTKFYTTVSTLVVGSGYFKGKLSDRWPVTRTGGIRHLYVDLNPDIFRYTLDILRTGKMPLLWNEETQLFDVKLYSSIGAQAHFLMMMDVVKWIERCRYKHVVTIKRRARIETKPWADDNGNGNDVLDSNGTIKAVVSNQWVKENHYPCPSGLHAERFRSYPCEQPTCQKARGKKDPIWVEVTRSRMTVVREKVAYNFEALDPAWKPTSAYKNKYRYHDWGNGVNAILDISDVESSDAGPDDAGDDDGRTGWEMD